MYILCSLEIPNLQLIINKLYLEHGTIAMEYQYTNTDLITAIMIMLIINRIL